MAKSNIETSFQNLVNVIKEKTAPISHQHTKNQITDFPESMPASDVYEWAKASTKPTYTASEVGALSASDGQTIQLQVAQLSASKLSISQVGVPNGVASLDDNGKVIELPTNLLTASQLGIADGIATLGNDGKIPDSQLPEITNDDTLLPGFINKVFGNSQVFYGLNVWTDGTDIYMSNGSYQWVLDRANSTWENKTWTGLTNFLGYNVWTDGEHIYYSNQTYQYELNKQTSEWTQKSWTGLTSFPGQHIWNDGDHIYLSNNGINYELNKETSTWIAKTWTGLTAFYGQYIWKDGEHIYYSYNGANYELNKETSTWSAKTWTGISGINLSGDLIWDDGKNIYFSYGASGNGKYQYMLDRENNTWMPIHWKGVTVTIYGEHIWKDGDHIYCSPTYSYEFVKLPIKALIGVANGIAELDSNGRIPINQTNYVTVGANDLANVGSYSTCEGYNTKAPGSYSHAEGANTVANGSYSHVEGSSSSIGNNAYASHAEGNFTQATAAYAHSEGNNTIAQHNNSHAGGYYTKTGRDSQFVTGRYNKGLTDTLLEVGDGTNNTDNERHNAFEVISGPNDHKVGIKVGDTIIDAVPTGPRGTTYYWHYNYPIHMSAGTWSHEDWTGLWVKFIVDNVVKKEGFIPQTYNGITIEATSYTYDGTNDEAIEAQVWLPIYDGGINIDGNIVAAGDITDGDGNVLSEKADQSVIAEVMNSDTALHALYENDTIIRYGVLYRVKADIAADASFTVGTNIEVKKVMDLADSSSCMKKGVDYVTAGRKANTTAGSKSTAEGYNTTASGQYSHAEGTAKATATSSHAEGDSTTASGYASHAEGIQTTASGDYSHAEGNYTTAGGYGHAEGERTTASGKWGHAQGYYCTASGLATHAEGAYCVASNDYSHVEGYYTKTGASHQHVQGKYNVGKSTTVFEIGNGTGTSAGARSNAFEVDWEGNIVSAGDITDGDGNVLSAKANTATVEAELAEKADISDLSSENTVTGNLITITDALPVPVKSLVANVEPIQDLHGYDHPWPGGGGKNKAYLQQGNYKFSDGTYNSAVTTYVCTQKIKIKPNTNYIVSTSFSNIGTYGFVLWDSNGDYLSYSLDTMSISTPSNAGYIAFNLGVPSGSTITPTDITDFQLEEGSQATTYEPYSNECPILGWAESKLTDCGKNICGVLVDNRVIQYSTGLTLVNNDYKCTNYIKVPANTPVTISNCTNGEENWYYDANKNPVHSIPKTPSANIRTITLSEDGYIRCSWIKSNTENLQIEIGSSATAYEPYNDNTSIIDLDGTRYGGYTTIDENGVTKFVGTHKLGTFVGGSDENWQHPNEWATGSYYLSSALYDAVAVPGFDTVANIISNLGEIQSVNTLAGGTGYGVGQGANYNLTVNFGASYDTTEKLKTYLASNNLQVCYPLATPIEVTLSDTNITLLDGYNYMTCDSGDVELTYRKGISSMGYMQEEIDELEEEIKDRVLYKEFWWGTGPTPTGPAIDCRTQDSRNLSMFYGQTSDLGIDGYRLVSANLKASYWGNNSLDELLDLEPPTVILRDWDTARFYFKRDDVAALNVGLICTYLKRDDV